MLKEHAGKITIKIGGIAASAASLIAMAGDTIQMSPTAIMMIHNPLTFAYGNKRELQKGIELLEEVEQAIINAYQMKTKKSREEIAQLMDEETWMNSYRALELGFIDEILYQEEIYNFSNLAFDFSKKKIYNCVQNSIQSVKHKIQEKNKQEEIEKIKLELEILSI